MTRHRSSAPGRSRPARRRSLPWLLLPVLALFLAAGCIGQDEVRDDPSPTLAASGTAAAPSAEPTIASSPSPSAEPAATPTAAPADAPTATPTAAPASDPPLPSGGAGSVASCSGNDDNRDFLADAAAAVGWPVYCAVLPARWFVDSGTYRTAGGGWLQIAYQGPGGARFELSEGSFCDDADGCVPAGADAGPAAFGDQSGTLVTADDGRFAVVVDRGGEPSWLAVGVGMDRETFTGFAAALLRLED